MIRFFDSLLAPEWRKFVHPSGFADGVLRCIRSLCDKIANIAHLKLIDKPTRPYYRALLVKTDEVIYDSVTKKYIVDLATPDVDVFGATLSKKTAVAGRDFIRNGTRYTFNEHPSAYGTTTSTKNSTIIVFICIGGAYNNSLNPLGLKYFGAANANERLAISAATATATPLGYARELLTAAFYCSITPNKVVDTWLEGGVRFALTDKGELMYAPQALNAISFPIGGVASTDNLLNPSYIFSAKINGQHHIISTGTNTADSFKNVFDEFPQLIPTRGGESFVGAQLLSLLKNEGCVFWSVPYIKDGIDQQALSNYAANAGKVAINVVAELPNNGVKLRSEIPTPVDYVAGKTISTELVAYNCM